MSKYVLIHGTFYEADELMHRLASDVKPKKNHKYVSREWKNGTWVYTYPEDSKPKSTDSKTAASSQDTKTTTNTASTAKKSDDTKALEPVKTITRLPAEIEKAVKAAVDSGKKLIESLGLKTPETPIDDSKQTTADTKSETDSVEQQKRDVAKASLDRVDSLYDEISKNGKHTPKPGDTYSKEEVRYAEARVFYDDAVRMHEQSKNTPDADTYKSRVTQAMDRLVEQETLYKHSIDLPMRTIEEMIAESKAARKKR